MNMYNFLKFSKESLRFFENILKFYRIFCENLGKNLENFRNVDFCGVRGRRPPKLAKILKN